MIKPKAVIFTRLMKHVLMTEVLYMELICVSDVYRVVIPFTETLRFSVYILCCVKNMYYLIPCISYIFELACSSLKLYEMGKYAKKKKIQKHVQIYVHVFLNFEKKFHLPSLINYCIHVRIQRVCNDRAHTVYLSTFSVCQALLLVTPLSDHC